ncbi:hypothetical protein [Sphingomonas sp.]|uniref:hypothetical protein n=1 Tax=Sphingomonas sp. TaxID=28214 RepID=UPI003B0083D3
MKVLVSVLAMLAAGAGHRPPDNQDVFKCSLGAKQVEVTAAGDQLVYRFGTKSRAELTIAGSVARRNLFYRSARFAGIEHQLRFTNGRFSYVVFSLAGNPGVGARGVSGLTVFDGQRTVSEFTCRRWTELNPSAFESWPIAEDGEDWSAI